MDRETLN